MGSGAITTGIKRKAASTKEVVHKLSIDDKDAFNIMKIKNIDSYIGSRKWSDEFKKKKNCMVREKPKEGSESERQEGSVQNEDIHVLHLTKTTSQIL